MIIRLLSFFFIVRLFMLTIGLHIIGAHKVVRTIGVSLCGKSVMIPSWNIEETKLLFIQNIFPFLIG